MRYALTVTAPLTAPVALRVYKADNEAAARTFADTDEASADQTQPITIAAGVTSTIYIDGPSEYWVSTLIGGVEMAAGEGVRKHIGEGHNSLSPDAPPWRAAPLTLVGDNSAAATTAGTITKKIEVFDSAGVSLGFLAVYDAIT